MTVSDVSSFHLAQREESADQGYVAVGKERTGMPLILEGYRVECFYKVSTVGKHA